MMMRAMTPTTAATIIPTGKLVGEFEMDESPIQCHVFGRQWMNLHYTLSIVERGRNTMHVQPVVYYEIKKNFH